MVNDESGVAAKALGPETAAIPVPGAHQQRGTLTRSDHFTFYQPVPDVVAGRAAQPCRRSRQQVCPGAGSGLPDCVTGIAVAPMAAQQPAIGPMQRFLQPGVDDVH
jgi:hypothetical protein